MPDRQILFEVQALSGNNISIDALDSQRSPTMVTNDVKKPSCQLATMFVVLAVDCVICYCIAPSILSTTKIPETKYMCPSSSTNTSSANYNMTLISGGSLWTICCVVIGSSIIIASNVIDIIQNKATGLFNKNLSEPVSPEIQEVPLTHASVDSDISFDEEIPDTLFSKLKAMALDELKQRLPCPLSGPCINF